MGLRLTPEARALLHRQRGVLACWQGPSVDMATRRLRQAPDRGSGWSWAGRRTLVLGDPDLSPEQLRVVGCLEAGSGAVLAGRSALLEAGWQHDDDGFVHVLVPRNGGAAARKMPHDVKVHYGEPGRLVHGPVYRTTNARAVVDAAGWAGSDRQAEFIVVSSLQGRFVTPDAVRACLAERRVVKRSALVREVLAEFSDGAQSMGELDFIRECRRRGLPEPQRQVARRDASGRLRFVDVEFRRPDGRLVMVEIDGLGHMSAEEWRADMVRHNDLVLTTDAVVLRVTAWEIRYDPEPFFLRLTAALGLL